MADYVCIRCKIPEWMHTGMAIHWIVYRTPTFDSPLTGPKKHNYMSVTKEFTFYPWPSPDSFEDPSNTQNFMHESGSTIPEEAMFCAVSEILLRLQRESLRARGLSFKEIPNTSERFDFEKTETWPNRSDPVTEMIQARAWNTSGFMWKESLLRSHLGIYKNVEIRTEDLFREFPPHTVEYMELEVRDGFLIYSDKAKASRTPLQLKRNRISKYDWDAIYQEAVRLALSGKLGKTQADAIRKLSEWCVTKWGDHPNETTMKGKLSPIYQNLSLDKPTKPLS